MNTKYIHYGPQPTISQPPATTCNHLQPPATTCNHLQPPVTTCNCLQLPATTWNILQTPKLVTKCHCLQPSEDTLHPTATCYATTWII